METKKTNHGNRFNNNIDREYLSVNNNNMDKIKMRVNKQNDEDQVEEDGDAVEPISEEKCRN